MAQKRYVYDTPINVKFGVVGIIYKDKGHLNYKAPERIRV